MRSAADIRAAAESGASRLATIEAARRAAAEHTIERNTSWQYACEWAAGLTAAQLKQAAALQIPGDAGLAIRQAIGRRS